MLLAFTETVRATEGIMGVQLQHIFGVFQDTDFSGVEFFFGVVKVRSVICGTKELLCIF